MRSIIGQTGHLFVIISFIASLLSAYGYWNFASEKPEAKKDWGLFARSSFWVHCLAVFGIVITLFAIIYNHFYEFHYAWSHSSRNLPTYYMVSCFWEGQEGSFLLWIFWDCLLGIAITRTAKDWEPTVMTIFSLVQAFLCSMILGVVFGDVRIGSSPFILMKEAMPDLPVFQINPDFIAGDGRGLNPLLQNYWMVIHPPTLFLGFATTLVPFAYAIAGLWKKRFGDWISPGLPWALFSATVLGIGILMGGYWAYETLNFGGYWNWDPVENAVYIPWLVLVGSIHAMIIYRKSEASLKAAIILAITSFLLILYATFLTRSGILGNSSVHSFTDLGLSGQLLIYLLAFVVLAVFLLAIRWKYLPSSEGEVSVWTREFWVFMGLMVLCLAAFQVLVTTSIPVYNAIAEGLGIKSNLAPPAEPIKHYTLWQMGFAALVAILSGIGQFVYWQKMKPGELFKALSMPAAISLLVSTIIIVAAKVDDPKYVGLLTVSVFSIIANGNIIGRLINNNVRLAGGAVAHIGIALMLIGILFSSGYSKVVSINRSGLIYRKEFSTEMNRDNILLWRATPQQMNNFTLTYKGNCSEVEGFPTYVKQEFLGPTDDPYKNVARSNLEFEGKTYFKKGDTVKVQPENTFYAVEFKRRNGTDSSSFVLFPRAQVNPNMGLVASPDIKRFAGADLYTHVSSIPPPEEEKKWKPAPEIKAGINDTFFVNDYVAQLVGVQKMDKVEGLKLGLEDAAVKAQIRILGGDQNYIAEPVFIIKDKQVGAIPATVSELGIRLSLTDIDPGTGKFTFALSTTDKDWIILKAIEKPGINVLWIGTFVMVLGFCMAIARRIREFNLVQNRKKVSVPV